MVQQLHPPPSKMHLSDKIEVILLQTLRGLA